MTQRPRVLFLSAVDGGPISRIVKAINDRGRIDIETLSALSTTRWKRRRGAGGVRSLTVRLFVLLLYPFWAALKARNADIVIASTNPFWLPNLLLSTRWCHRARVVTLVYDAYPDSLKGHWSDVAIVRRVMHALNGAWTRSSDTVVYISEGMRLTLTTRYGRPRASQVIVTGTDASEFTSPRAQPDLEEWVKDRRLISFVGNAGHVHDVHTLAEVLCGLAAHEELEVAVLISATGTRAAALRLALSVLDDVWWEPVLPEDRWRWVMARTDVAAISLAEQSATASMPSRFFSALGSGSAVLAIAPTETDLHIITNTSGVGIAVKPGDSASAVTGLTEILTMPGVLASLQSKARRMAGEDYDVNALAIKWEELLFDIPRVGELRTSSHR